MAAAYSQDLRQKILQAHERGQGSQREIAERFDVSLSFVEKLLRQYRETGQYVAKRRTTPMATRRLNEAARQQVYQWLLEQPDMTLAELGEQLQQIDLQASQPTLSRVVKALGFTRKKRPYMPANATRPRYVWHVKSIRCS